MQDWLAARAQASPEKFLFSNNKRTYNKLDRWGNSLAEWIREIGIGAYQPIALLLPNTPYYADIIFALIRLKGVIVPLNTRLTAEEINWQLAQSECKVVIASYYFHELAQQLVSSDKQIYIYDHDYPPDGLLTVPEPKSWSTIHDWIASLNEVTGEWELRLPPDNTPDLRNPISLDAPFAIIHTSGTSGKPKGAVLTYGNVFYSAMASAYHIGHQPDDKWLCVLPLYHVGGLSIIIRAVLYGITVDLQHKFNVDEVNHALSHEDVTLVSLVPTMLYRLLEARKEPWSPKLRLVLLGGAVASPELIERCKAEGIPLATTYGMTEASSQIATTLPGEAVRKPGSVGKPLLLTQIRVVDENDNNVRTGEYGEIIVKGPTVMKEYYGNPEATAKTLRNGWLHTGDIGYLDADGDLFLVQRRSDLIVSGGENVYPAEVESVLRQHPAVKDVAVVGIDDAEWGQTVAAAIVLRDGQSVTEKDVEDYARTHLAGYKIPRVVKFVTELPQTASGKVERVAVKGLFANRRDAEDTEN